MMIENKRIVISRKLIQAELNSYISKERKKNMFVVENFIRSFVKIYSRHTVYTLMMVEHRTLHKHVDSYN